jgi:hypothetical protein
MQIDENIERHVRAAFSAVIGQKPDDLKAALKGLSPADLQTGVTYAIYVCGYVVLEVLDGEVVEDGIAELARDIVEGNKIWTDLDDVSVIASFLKAAAAGNINFPGVPEEDAAGLAFVAGGYLLTRYRHDGQRWFEHLDDVWNAALAAEA